MFKNLLNLFYPKVCLSCKTLLLANENVICTWCRHEIPLTLHQVNPENEAFKKFYGKIPVEFAMAFFYFHKKGIVQELIHNLKYKGYEEIGHLIGDWCASEIAALDFVKTISVVIPVPLHSRKQKERGYNQVTTFGKSLAKNLNLDYNEQILVRSRYSKTQTRKNLLSRIEVNKASVFAVKFTSDDYNKHFLLIDDVLTTGSTLEACGKELLKIPGAKISVLCIAMSH